MVTKQIKKILEKKGYTTQRQDEILENRIMSISNEEQDLDREERLINKKLSGEDINEPI